VSKAVSVYQVSLFEWFDVTGCASKDALSHSVPPNTQYPRLRFVTTMSKWAIVTGAGTGIGQALTTALAGCGVHVLAVGRRQEPLDAVAAAAPTGVVHPLQGDISQKEVIEKIAEAIPAGDQLCYLIQNAAVGVPSRLADLKREDFEYALAVNVTAPLFLTQRLLPRLQASQGRILHLGTGVAFNAQIGTATYGLTKMAFHRLYEQLRVELAGTGVLVGSVSPGMVHTEGLSEHLKLAKEEQLPHVAYFAQAEQDGLIREADLAAKFLLFLLQQAGDEEFSRQEWKLGDQTHWDRWHPELVKK